jgi:hypothetical protein
VTAEADGAEKTTDSITDALEAGDPDAKNQNTDSSIGKALKLKVKSGKPKKEISLGGSANQ